MKITDLRIRELDGILEHPDPFWEERLVRRMDVYSGARAQGPEAKIAEERELSFRDL